MIKQSPSVSANIADTRLDLQVKIHSNKGIDSLDYSNDCTMAFLSPHSNV